MFELLWPMTFEGRTIYSLHVLGSMWWITCNGRLCTVRDYRRPGWQAAVDKAKRQLRGLEVMRRETP